MNITSAARQHTGLNQSEFGELVGTLARNVAISQSRISEYERGAVHPKPEVRQVMAPWAARKIIAEAQGKPLSAMESLMIECME